MTSENEKALADVRFAGTCVDAWELSQVCETLSAHVNRLVAEVEDYAAKERLRRDNFKAAVDRAEQLASRVKALEAYTMHRRDCNCALPSEYRRGDGCTCGLTALLSEVPPS